MSCTVYQELSIIEWKISDTNVKMLSFSAASRFLPYDITSKQMAARYKNELNKLTNQQKTDRKQ